MLQNYNKPKRAKTFRLTISSFSIVQYVLVTTAESFSEKRRSVPLIQDFYISFYIEFEICPLDIKLLQKAKKRYKV